MTNRVLDALNAHDNVGVPLQHGSGRSAPWAVSRVQDEGDDRDSGVAHTIDPTGTGRPPYAAT